MLCCCNSARSRGGSVGVPVRGPSEETSSFVLGEQQIVQWKHALNPESSDYVGRLYCLVTTCKQCHASHEAPFLVASHYAYQFSMLHPSTPKTVGWRQESFLSLSATVALPSF